MIPKFRAWDKRSKEMCKVSTLHIEDEYVDLFKVSIYEDPLNDRWAKFGDIVLMQSTGLKDKNDVEIFEGDIVLENGMEQVISLGEQRHEENFGDVVYYIGFNIFTKWGYSSIDPKEHEVIGNIYENPELLNLR